MVMLTDIYVLSPDSKERTFQYDKDLPSLPLPSLSNTLAKYLDSVEPLVTEEEFKKTKKIVKEFENGIGKELNEKLKQRAATERNWLERWWEDYAYLCNREPLLPGCNMTGPSPTTELGWKYAPGKQALFAARYCYHLVSIWIFLRQQRYRPMKVKSQKTGELKIFNMNQYRRLFNTCQVPRNFMDEMVKHFRTETEGDCPSHVIVIHKGRLYKMEAFLDSGEQLTTAEWQKSLSLIIEDALEKEVQGDNVACLSSDNRDIWAENREYMTSLDSRNAEILHEIESSMFVLSLDDDCPETQSAISHLSLAGDLTCRWADKALQIVFFNNGSSAGVCNHAAYDGIVSVTTMHFLHLSLTENRDNWEESISVRPNLKVPTELEFVVDSELKQRISDALLRQEEKKQQFVMTRMVFNNFGKDHIQQTHKLHPDAFVQLALQLAYFKLHKRPAPAYETANTRTFYNGRTETHRSCTKEAVAWCKAMLDKTKTAIEKSNLLKLAVEKHVRLLKEAEQNAGCDRHLFGLQCIAFENNIETPEIFLDPSYIKSGGNGNFILSTSLVGYTPLGGGVMPMCLHGYGCFYNISSPKISMTVSVRHDSDETSAFKFFDKFSEALLEMDELPCVQNISTSKL